MDEAGRRRIEHSRRLEGGPGLAFLPTDDVIVMTRYVSTATKSETNISPLVRRKDEFYLLYTRLTPSSACMRESWSTCVAAPDTTLACKSLRSLPSASVDLS